VLNSELVVNMKATFSYYIDSYPFHSS